MTLICILLAKVFHKANICAQIWNGFILLVYFIVILLIIYNRNNSVFSDNFLWKSYWSSSRCCKRIIWIGQSLKASFFSFKVIISRTAVDNLCQTNLTKKKSGKGRPFDARIQWKQKVKNSLWKKICKIFHLNMLVFNKIVSLCVCGCAFLLLLLLFFCGFFYCFLFQMEKKKIFWRLSYRWNTNRYWQTWLACP
jgi:hypothetical protein